MSDQRARAERFAELFRAVYLTFHRRDGPRSQLAGASRAVLEHLALAGPLDGPRSQLAGASRAVLEHLALAGPLTVGEAAAHLSRAQSVISEIVAHLERHRRRRDDPQEDA